MNTNLNLLFQHTFIPFATSLTRISKNNIILTDHMNIIPLWIRALQHEYCRLMFQALSCIFLLVNYLKLTLAKRDTFITRKDLKSKIIHMWRRWGTLQNFSLVFIDELEKQIFIKKNSWSEPIKKVGILIFTMLHLKKIIKKEKHLEILFYIYVPKILMIWFTVADWNC